MHLGLLFQGTVVQRNMQLEDVPQNKAMGMAFTVDTKYKFKLHPK